MAGRNSRKFELAEGVGSLFVRFQEVVGGRAIYAWSAKSSDGHPVAAGLDLALSAGAKADSRQALLVVVDHMRSAGRQFVEEREGEQRADFHD